MSIKMQTGFANILIHKIEIVPKMQQTEDGEGNFNTLYNVEITIRVNDRISKNKDGKLRTIWKNIPDYTKYLKVVCMQQSFADPRIPAGRYRLPNNRDLDMVNLLQDSGKRVEAIMQELRESVFILRDLSNLNPRPGDPRTHLHPGKASPIKRAYNKALAELLRATQRQDDRAIQGSVEAIPTGDKNTKIINLQSIDDPAMEAAKDLTPEATIVFKQFSLSDVQDFTSRSPLSSLSYIETDTNESYDFYYKFSMPFTVYNRIVNENHTLLRGSEEYQGNVLGPYPITPAGYRPLQRIDQYSPDMNGVAGFYAYSKNLNLYHTITMQFDLSQFLLDSDVNYKLFDIPEGYNLVKKMSSPPKSITTLKRGTPVSTFTMFFYEDGTPFPSAGESRRPSKPRVGTILKNANGDQVGSADGKTWYLVPYGDEGVMFERRGYPGALTIESRKIKNDVVTFLQPELYPSTTLNEAAIQNSRDAAFINDRQHILRGGSDLRRPLSPRSRSKIIANNFKKQKEDYNGISFLGCRPRYTYSRIEPYHWDPVRFTLDVARKIHTSTDIGIRVNITDFLIKNGLLPDLYERILSNAARADGQFVGRRPGRKLLGMKAILYRQQIESFDLDVDHKNNKTKIKRVLGTRQAVSGRVVQREEFYFHNDGEQEYIMLDFTMRDTYNQKDDTSNIDKASYLYSVELEFVDPLLEELTKTVNYLRKDIDAIDTFLQSTSEFTRTAHHDSMRSFGLGTLSPIEFRGWSSGVINPITHDYTLDFVTSNLAINFNQKIEEVIEFYIKILEDLTPPYELDRDFILDREARLDEQKAILQNSLSVAKSNSPRTLRAFRDELQQLYDYLSSAADVNYDTTQPKVSMPIGRNSYETFLRRNSNINPIVKVSKEFTTTPVTLGLSSIQCYNQGFVSEYHSPMLSERRASTKIENDVRRPYYNKIPIPMSPPLRSGADGEGSISYSEFVRYTDINFKWFNAADFTRLFGPEGSIQRLFTNEEIEEFASHQAAEVGVRRAARPVWMED